MMVQVAIQVRSSAKPLIVSNVPGIIVLYGTDERWSVNFRRASQQGKYPFASVAENGYLASLRFRRQ